MGPGAGVVVAVDYGDGPMMGGVVDKTVLFVAWFAWSRFRVVIALGDKKLPMIIGARQHVPAFWWGPDVCVDRQRTHGHRSPYRRDRGVEPDDG